VRVLFVGDVVGKPGRVAVGKCLAALREKHALDLIVTNAENAAGGHGATPEILKELEAAGSDAFTMGNHTWRKRAIYAELDARANIVRPANYPAGAPGRGAAIITLKDGRKLAIVNLLGRVYMEPLDCPFHCVDGLLPELARETNAILVDMHAEATSEKIAMGWHLDGRCSAVVGTHTHVQTADNRVLPKGTAYITDVGMCGPENSVIGTEVEPVLTRFKTGLPQPFNVAKGPALFCGVIIDIDDETGKSTGIERVRSRHAM